MLQNLGNLALREEAGKREFVDAEYRICGIIARSPVKGNGETVDTETLPRLIDQLIDNGAHAIAP